MNVGTTFVAIGKADKEEAAEENVKENTGRVTSERLIHSEVALQAGAAFYQIGKSNANKDTAMTASPNTTRQSGKRHPSPSQSKLAKLKEVKRITNPKPIHNPSLLP